MLNSEKTAISNGTSKSCKWIIKNIRDKKILDFGAGRLRNTIALREAGFDVVPMDTSKQVGNLKTYDQLKEKFPVILCSFVLNVLNPDEQIKAMEQIRLLSEGMVVIEVRQPKEILNAKTGIVQPCGGYIMQGGTYQYPFTQESLTFLISPYFNIVEKHGMLFICEKI